MVQKVEIEFEGADRLGRNLRGAREVILANQLKALRNVGRAAMPIFKDETPKGKPAPNRARPPGRLRSSTRFEIKTLSGLALEIRQGAKTAGGAFYGLFVRGGTAPHTIRPHKAKALHFWVGGREVFAQKVDHPGTKPNRYHLRAMKRLMPILNRELDLAGSRIVERLADMGSS